MTEDNTTAICLSDEQRAVIRHAFNDAFPGNHLQDPRPEVESAISRLYAAVGLRNPLFFYADNPCELMQMAFLLQSIASVPHGKERRQLLRSRIPMPPPDLAWQLSNSLSLSWRSSLIKLMEQLDPTKSEDLSDDTHRTATNVSYYCEPDLLKTCGSRLGFPAAPALAALYEEVVRDCLGRVWQRTSSNVARELVTLVQEHKSQPIWRQRAGIEIAINGGGSELNLDRLDDRMRHLINGMSTDRSTTTWQPALENESFLQMLLAGARQDNNALGLLMQDFSIAWDLSRQLHSSSLSKRTREELFGMLDNELLWQLVLLQDTRCYHERVDGTSALKPAAHVHQQSQDPKQRLVEACANEIYMMNWGSWLQDELCIWRIAQTLWDAPLYSSRLASLLNDFWTLRGNAFSYIFGSRAVFVCTNPTQLRWSDADQLHHWNEPAVQFADGLSWHFWRGIYISPRQYERFKDQSITPINEERNAELRRVLIERFGTARYLQESGAIMVDSDEFGQLFRKIIPGDEPLTMVRVRNSTPDPDGTFRYYFLRVPPSMETARQAVAWTFNMPYHDYAPEVES